MLNAPFIKPLSMHKNAIVDFSQSLTMLLRYFAGIFDLFQLPEDHEQDS